METHAEAIPSAPSQNWLDLVSAAHAGDRAGTPVIGSLVGGKLLAAEHEMPGRISPATGTKLFVGGDTVAAPAEAAIRAARASFDSGAWGASTGRDRSRVLARAAALMESRADSFATLLVLETGKPITEAKGEVTATINAFEYFSGLARDVNGRTQRDIDRGLFAFTVREPAGVAGIIVPWNFPLGILGQKLPPALAAGCTAVVKPSPLTPLTSLATAQVLFEAGLEPEALSVVIGDGAVGAHLVAHPEIDVISFTGSTATGRHIASAAGQHRLKRVAIEAGGKTPVIVTRKANLDAAVEGLTFAAFFNQGEVCVAGSRILAESPIAEELGGRLAERAAQLRLGDPWSQATQMGPLVSQDHFDGVRRALDASEAEGTTVLAGGRQTSPEGTAATPFLAPTVLWSDSDDRTAVRDELFGPVTVVQPYEELAEVLMRANRSQYGLAASVWTSDLDEAMHAVLGLRTGTVWVNGSTDAFPEIPLGGRRDSGYGAEFGREGMEFFTESKTVQIRGAGVNDWYGAR